MNTTHTDTALLEAHIAACQSLLRMKSMTVEEAWQPRLILTYFGSGEGAPRYRVVSVEDWERSRERASDATWTPVAQVDVDGALRRL